MADHEGMTIPSRSLIILLTSLPLGGCGHHSETLKSSPAFSLEMRSLLNRMDHIGQVRFPMLRPGSVLPSEMNRPMCWDWSGSVDDGIRQIARQVGYTVISPPLRGGRTISIHEDHATAGELINQIAAAANPYLNVDVDILNHTIRVTQNA
ncbi:DotD/TraH family lipoprotein [Acetobacter syzygii]|uniref:Secretion protein n=2 Tax=Acetobacter syzygii TaxID=146476 RepID=A0A270B787_9PROT|nr:DotD/TraH family lipoprotein [Acetobacter syzygii]PAL20838.1 hypothetical protein B9K05_12535 [Acetobacter syzygii]PAL22937.1 hypothetical protein B9K04_12535 [Acetobacter syzygii]